MAARVRTTPPPPKGGRVIRYSLPPWAFRLARLAQAGKISVG
jgi:hypothetical protein